MCYYCNNLNTHHIVKEVEHVDLIFLCLLVLKLIAYPRSDDDDDCIDINTVSNALSRVCKESIDGNVDVSIEQLLNNAKVSVTHYKKALDISTKGNAIACT